MAGRRFIVALLAASIASAPAAAQDAHPLEVVASFSILADLVHHVGGDRVTVDALVGRNADAHAYEPSPADSKRLAGAALVVVNGLGYEGWLDRLVAASGTRALVVVASAGVVPRVGAGADDDHHAGTDPHAWQSVTNVARYMTNIRNALSRADPDGASIYAANAAAYQAQLAALDREIMDTVAGIPADRRRVITGHAAFGYFADAYGFVFVAPQGIAAEVEPSARAVARIITQIKSESISAVFLENVVDPRLARQIVRETGARIGGTIYSDALTGPDGPAPSYIALMRHNARTLAAALSR